MPDAAPFHVARAGDAPFTTDALNQAGAALLVAAFARHWPDAWPTLADGLAEMAELREPERILLIAFAPADAGTPARFIGLIGGIPEYDGVVWELHPLAVDAAWRGQGVGRALVGALEAAVRAAGGLTVTVGTDDQSSQTTASDTDLLDAPWRHIRDLAQRPDADVHPLGFYRAMGYAVTGLVPDANGPGKPDILMTKRL